MRIGVTKQWAEGGEARDYIIEVRLCSPWATLCDCLSPATVLVLRTARSKLFDGEFEELWFFLMNKKGGDGPPPALCRNVPVSVRLSSKLWLWFVRSRTAAGPDCFQRLVRNWKISPRHEQLTSSKTLREGGASLKYEGDGRECFKLRTGVLSEFGPSTSDPSSLPIWCPKGVLLPWRRGGGGCPGPGGSCLSVPCPGWRRCRRWALPGPKPRQIGGPESGAPRVGAPKGGEPKKNRAVFFPSPAPFFSFYLSLSGSLLVELWPRVSQDDPGAQTHNLGGPRPPPVATI